MTNRTLAGNLLGNVKDATVVNEEILLTQARSTLTAQTTKHNPGTKRA
jgi:hypothetical protein